VCKTITATGGLNFLDLNRYIQEEDSEEISEGPGVGNYPVGFAMKDMLSAAAAVGNNEAVNHYQARGAKLVDLATRDPTKCQLDKLGELVKAAARTAQTAMVRRIVELARRKYHGAADHEQSFIRGTFSGALGNAIDAGDMRVP